MSAMTKEKLRTGLLDRRRSLSVEEIVTARRAVTAHAMERAAAAGWHTVAGFEPLRTEPGSVELLDGLAAAGVAVLVPVLLSDRDLDWREWGGGDLLGRLAVRRCEAVFVPALAVSVQGARLGRGGGSYDRALERCRPGAPIIALVYADEVLADLPTDAWDRPVDEAITPNGRQVLRIA